MHKAAKKLQYCVLLSQKAAVVSHIKEGSSSVLLTSRRLNLAVSPLENAKESCLLCWEGCRYQLTEGSSIVSYTLRRWM